MEDRKSRTQKIGDRLRTLREANSDIEASAVASGDGLTIASDLPHEVEEDRVSAMSAAMLSLGDRIAQELTRGSLDQVYIHGNRGSVLLMAAGSEAVLTALAQKDAKLGLVFLELRRAAADIAAIM